MPMPRPARWRLAPRHRVGPAINPTVRVPPSQRLLAAALLTGLGFMAGMLMSRRARR